ncbi:MAG: prepilin-type N-terminal cleavage/methylation domain-containing protein [Deltaproteobacteria bacterium]|nr:prepilin-type N-terminal cleavage/methylation domain-containing protein [Deltaproteobacteria bacterium]
MTRRRAQAGFTLIELMIAMMILAMISVGIYDITTSSFDKREKIEAEGDFYNSLRVGLDVLGRDLTAIYSPQASALPGDLGKPPQQAQPGQQGQPQGQQPTYQSSEMPQGTPTDFWGEPLNQQGVRPTRFQGEETKMSFISSSHMRLYRDTPESEFAKIAYSLEEPKNPDPNAKVKSKLLVKREDPNILGEDGRPSDTEVSYTLIENVKNVTFEYLDGEKDTWSKRWDTSSADHKSVFPSIIKVTVEVFVPNTESTLIVTQEYRPELNL